MSIASAEATDALDLNTLAQSYADGHRTPSGVVAAIMDRIAHRGSDGVWISLTPPQTLLDAARAVEARRRAGQSLPLYGVPFAVKDNIDVAGLPTTAACPAFSYMPTTSARVVEALVAAGALVIGKTNLDQFATGLVGVRSPYGVPRNPFNEHYITGGSSSGSAVAVAVGQACFALGTDTAGSGRVPAALNNVVGLKPSRGVISTTGVVPACRSLDCVSVFAATCEDAARVAELVAGYDPTDPFSRLEAASVRFTPAAATTATGGFRFGVPSIGHRRFPGDDQARAAFDEAMREFASAGGTAVDVDLDPFFEAGSLLYDGPFVAERLEAAGTLLARQPEALLAPIRSILEGARRHDAKATFAAQTRLSMLRRQIAALWPTIDFLLLPTVPGFPTIDAVTRDPLGVNAALGLYTTFANLLDLAALAVPAGFRDDGLPAGVTLLGPWGSDARLASFGSRFHRAVATTVGATGWPLPVPTARTPATPTALPTPVGTPSIGENELVPIAVVGAHLSGQPLNWQLTNPGGRLLRICKTAPRYRLFAIPGTVPPKPGLLRASDVADPGVAVDLEVWGLPPTAFAAFVAGIPAPLCIGKVELEDGTQVSGFLCEAHATRGARDISAFGGWRGFLVAQANA